MLLVMWSLTDNQNYRKNVTLTYMFCISYRGPRRVSCICDADDCDIVVLVLSLGTCRSPSACKYKAINLVFVNSKQRRIQLFKSSLNAVTFSRSMHHPSVCQNR